MSDSSLDFEPEDEGQQDSIEIREEGYAEPEPEPDESKVTLSKEDYEKLLKGGDQSAAVLAGLQGLGESLRPPQPVQQSPQPPAFDPEAIEAEAFTPKGFVTAVEKVAQRMLAQNQGPIAAKLVEQGKTILKLDPNTKDLFTKYEGEIERRIAALPQNYQLLPDIYQRVFQQVCVDKQGEIVELRASELAQKKIDEALAAAGIKPGEKSGATAPAVKKPAMYQESGSRSIAAGAKPAKSGQYLTQADVEHMMAIGMDPKSEDQKRSYLEKVASKRRK